MPILKESSIERRTCALARLRYGVINVKIEKNGWPDRQFLIPGGRPLFIEFKRPGFAPRPLQHYVHDMLRRISYDVKVCDSVSGALACIATAVETATVHDTFCEKKKISAGLKHYNQRKRAP